ncbi:hypothetical protein [Saccharopolyspora flava]|uniref:AAA domain-containing protein n=1 Tax=Saccharopolyspora flava TaxID=95161 RepID=A0A1I6Q264_9PSEU|nr:hypothetical protein [Saccharopolyspora flava]SFS46513.1 hypothetical protein SAMN05660874_01319 [Saccharopolyspora flava]
MLLLVSGASGVGKTTARLHARPLLDESVETAELFTLGEIPAVPTIAWRQQQVEVAVRRAIELNARGEHLLFAGDPVPLGEVLAAPSADRIDVAACLLDIDEQTHLARLAKRGDPEELIPLHQGFAAWLRTHATDPSHLPEAVTRDAWPEMRWHRWTNRAPGPEWAVEIIDTSPLTPQQLGAEVAAWCRRALTGRAPVFPAGWFDQD